MKNKTLIFLTPIILIILSFKLTLFNPAIYSQDQDTQNVIDFLKNKAELNDKFTLKEKLHFKDVKSILNKINLVFYFLLIIYGYLLFNLKSRITETLFYAGIVSLVTSTLFITSILLFFSSVFVNMHHLLFKNNLWVLSPNLLTIQLFPQSFFYKFSIIFITIAIILSIGLILIGFLSKRFLKLRHI